MQILPIDQNKLNNDNYTQRLDYIIFYLRSVLYTNLRDCGVFGFTKLSDKELLREYLKVCTGEDVKSLLKLTLLLVDFLEGRKVEVAYKYEVTKTIVSNNRTFTICKYSTNPLYIYDGEGSLKKIEIGDRCTDSIFLESLYTETLRGFIKGRDRKVLKK